MADYIDRQGAIKALDDIIYLPNLIDSTRKPLTMARDIVAARPGVWVSTGDRPPERDGYYLCLSRFKLFDGTLDKNIRMHMRYYSASAQCFEGQRLSLITHWMPTPDLPMEEQTWTSKPKI